MVREQTESFFGNDSPLRGNGASSGVSFKYEPRQQQVDMALAVADAFDNGENLCVEAPTGVGKTFAYLVPAFFHACQMDKPVVITTHTISLQDQILNRDIPLLSKFLDVKIDAVVAKGRSNYLCLRKLNEIADMDQSLLPDDNITGDLGRLISWAEKTKTGDHTDMNRPISPQLWNAVCCERGNCLNGQCPFFASCFLMAARRRIGKARIIIANHAFFFAALATDAKLASMPSSSDSQREKLLPEFCGLVIDEGHTLEDAAANHLGIRTDSFTIRRLLGRLYSDERKSGLLSSERFTEARELVVDARRRATLFFTSLINWMEPQNKNPLRYFVPNHIENYLATPFAKLEKALAKLADEEEDAATKVELQCLHDSIEEHHAALDTFFSMAKSDFVYWMEIFGKDKNDISFNCVPVDVSPLLAEQLFQKPPVIITSATLAVSGDIHYFMNRVGAVNAKSMILDTPFDFKKQVQTYIARNMPDPRDLDIFLDKAEEHLHHFLKLTAGRTFVLFTSYKMMNNLAKRMETFFQENNLTLLQQGDGLPTLKMIEKFKSTERAVIFGTSSFWTGVDVPGDALSSVIIMRLPFANPDHPLELARTERTEAIGKNAFFDYTVPEAVLKFRQGFGRLIRTKDDTGIVVILDSRIIQKRYGQSFLRSIPECPVQLID
ncbi:MAG: DEAD/DEAH box helicase [Lentisphaeria bacterium]|nr:DEAD/DEAH box helicase [Lentisphaeria bacterium]